MPLIAAAVERVIHSLPEGLLIALFAWAVMRVLPKQNSRTRFAVWFVALFAVVGLACIGGSLSEIPHPDVAKSATLEWGTHSLSAHGWSSLSFISSRISAIHLPAHWGAISSLRGLPLLLWPCCVWWRDFGSRGGSGGAAFR